MHDTYMVVYGRLCNDARRYWVHPGNYEAGTFLSHWLGIAK